ncbi:MAG TPA: ATP-binding cassette domain-containing protein, partial [Pyrodictiaceae archaeon]|nr:ATP-binding cassette domain-containing protein [Pyrodictiaceae archaeon]
MKPLIVVLSQGSCPTVSTKDTSLSAFSTTHALSLLRHTRLSAKKAKEIAIEKLRLVGLKDVEDLMPSELSGGMKKRVGLARAIAHEPEIILYDEPTTGLDPIMADAINDLIIRLREHLRVTSVTITH